MKPLQNPHSEKGQHAAVFYSSFFLYLFPAGSPAHASQELLAQISAAADVEQASQAISAAHHSTWTPLGQPALQQQRFNPLCRGDFYGVQLPARS